MGPKQERRIHQVFVTENTEYHLRRDRCVGVRDRRSGEWRADHGALQRRVAAAVTLLANGSLTAEGGLPAPGQRIIFDGDSSVLTGPVIAIERPEKFLVMDYPCTDPGT
ncbi:MAG: hypothetical protein JRH11_12855 [Deltaproteobacteria bacterium]|nr:hypothetical protein [Deltaproteobacteria bacterium]